MPNQHRKSASILILSLLLSLAQAQEFGNFFGDLVSNGVFSGIIADDFIPELISAKYIFNEREYHCEIVVTSMW